MFYHYMSYINPIRSFNSSLWMMVQVYGQRSGVCRRLLGNEHELFFLIRALIENHALHVHNASFSEHVYGMRRVSANSTVLGSTVLSPSQRKMSLVLLTLEPFLKVKLMQLYREKSERHELANIHWSDVGRLWKQGKYVKSMSTALMKAFPMCYTSFEGVDLIYKLLYLLNMTQYYSLGLQFLGLRMARVSARDLSIARQEKARHRVTRMNQIDAQSHWSITRLIRRSLLRGQYLVHDNATTVLIFAVFAFKALEWWYTEAEEHAFSRQGQFPIPPPPPTMPAEGGQYVLPNDPSVCPICRKERKNPTMVSRSGYVFCYACVFKHVDDHGTCPVTGIDASNSDLRRIFKGSD